MNNEKGFTLVEMIISVGIVGLVVAVAFNLPLLMVRNNKHMKRDMKTYSETMLIEGSFANSLQRSTFAPYVANNQGLDVAITSDYIYYYYKDKDGLYRVPTDTKTEDVKDAEEEIFNGEVYLKIKTQGGKNQLEHDFLISTYQDNVADEVGIVRKTEEEIADGPQINTVYSYHTPMNKLQLRAYDYEKILEENEE